MRSLITALIRMLVVCHVWANAQNEELTLPAEIVRLLDSNYPGWWFPQLTEPWRISYFQKTKTNPNLISGDFDGDGQQDYAAHIHFTDTSSNSDEVVVIVFLQRDESYQKFILETYSVDPGFQETLHLVKKGSKRKNVEIHQPFILPNDGINLGSEKGSVTYFWHDGSFQSVLTGD